MNEIKFRAWDTFLNEWVYQEESGYFDFIDNLTIDYDKERFILEQYTEANDKTNTEIYKNDILESGLSKHKYVVVKENGAWVGRSLTSGILVLPFRGFAFSKVIGNTHEEMK
jgi:hypothetical protein